MDKSKDTIILRINKTNKQSKETNLLRNNDEMRANYGKDLIW